MNFITGLSIEIWNIFYEMSSYLLIGFIFAGILRFIFSDKFILKNLGKKNFKSVFLATIFGIPLPLCSCGVVPAALSLKKQGASNGAVMAFLMSTPQTGVDSISVTYGFLGWPLTLFKIITALVTGLVSGTISNLMIKEEKTVAITKGVTEKPQNFFGILNYIFFDLILSIRKWLLIGIVLAALISYLIPKDFTEIALSSNNRYIFYLIVLLIATPLYVCATASVPIAASLLIAGFPPGAALVFLIAGPGTNITTLTVLWSTLGKKDTLIYLLTILIFSFFFGFLFDYFFPDYYLNFSEGHHHHSESLFNMVGTIIFGFLLILSYIKPLFEKLKKAKLTDTRIEFRIENVNCMSCVEKIKNRLKTFKHIKTIELDVNGKCILFVDNLNFSEVEVMKSLDELGYKMVP